MILAFQADDFGLYAVKHPLQGRLRGGRRTEGVSREKRAMVELNDDIPHPGSQCRSLDHRPVSNRQEISIPLAPGIGFQEGTLWPLRADLKNPLGPLGEGGHGKDVKEMKEVLQLAVGIA